MASRKSLCLVLLSLLTPVWPGQALAQNKIVFDHYHPPGEVSAAIGDFAVRYPQLARVWVIGNSKGGTPLQVLELADKSSGLVKLEGRPAILVCANLEGTHLIGTEAALRLADRLLAGATSESRIKELLAKKVVYIAPLLNPDAVAAGFFATPQGERCTNAGAVDEDIDGLLDEDGPDDLNNDGVITMMRSKDPEGEWIVDPDEPRLMRKADAQKGESGAYKLYFEGIDNDGDESYNEDPPGGVDLNRNFAHDFENNSAVAGMWPVSQPESKALIDFMLAHPNIALVLNFSSENTILNMEQTGRAKATGERVKVPERFAGYLGVDPSQEFDFKEVVEMVRSSGLFGGSEVTEDRVAQILGLGASVTLDRSDLPFFEAVQKEYKEALKAAGSEYPEKKAKAVGKGSFAAYSYYQYGVPVFSTDIWTVPEAKKPTKDKSEELTLEKVKSMTSEQFLSLEDARLEAFLKSQSAPARFGVKEIRKLVESGQSTPVKIAEMAERMAKARPAGAGGSGSENPDLDPLRWSDSALSGKGFVNWTPFAHPTLGAVEIGGFMPFAKLLPPASEIEKQIAFPVDFYLKLMEKTAGLSIRETRVKSLSEGVYGVTCFLSNSGWLPTSTAQGRRAGNAWPITVRIQADKDLALFSGRPIESVQSIGGGETRKVEWTIRAKAGSKVEISASSPKLGAVSTLVTLQ